MNDSYPGFTCSRSLEEIHFVLFDETVTMDRWIFLVPTPMVQYIQASQALQPQNKDKFVRVDLLEVHRASRESLMNSFCCDMNFILTIDTISHFI